MKEEILKEAYDKLKQEHKELIEGFKAIAYGTFKDNNGVIYCTDFAQLKICKELARQMIEKYEGKNNV